MVTRAAVWDAGGEVCFAAAKPIDGLIGDGRVDPHRPIPMEECDETGVVVWWAHGGDPSGCEADLHVPASRYARLALLSA